MEVTPLGSAAEVLAATGPDPFVRSSLRRQEVRGWAIEGAAGWLGVDPDDGTPYLSTLGPPSRITALLAELLPELPAGQPVTVPRGTPDDLPEGIRLRGTDWDLRWIARASVEPSRPHSLSSCSRRGTTSSRSGCTPTTTADVRSTTRWAPRTSTGSPADPRGWPGRPDPPLSARSDIVAHR